MKSEKNKNKTIPPNLINLIYKSMCGIIGIINTKNSKSINNKVLELYQDQRSRGTEGFGVILIKKDGSCEIKRACHENKMMIDLSLPQNKRNIIFLHHRSPTSTDNLISQTHPIIIDLKSLEHKYFLFHNGIIRNAQDLKEEHEKLNLTYSTNIPDERYQDEFNDSESLGIELARFIEKQNEIINIQGSAAFILFQVNKKTDKIIQIFYGQKDGKLKMQKSEDQMIISSENSKGYDIKENRLYQFNLKDFKIKKSKLKFPEKEFTGREIIKEPTTIYPSSISNIGFNNDENAKYEDDVKIEEVIEKCGNRITDYLEDYFDKLKDEEEKPYILNEELYITSIIQDILRTTEAIKSIRTQRMIQKANEKNKKTETEIGKETMKTIEEEIKKEYHYNKMCNKNDDYPHYGT